MTKEQRTHLIADESLGGLLREYVETDRKAVVGDYVVGALSGDFYHAVSVDESGRIYNDDGGHVRRENYITLEPTDVIHHEGARYKLADRIAEVGEKVVTVKYDEDSTGIKAGDVLICEEVFRAHDGSISVNGEGFFDTLRGDKYFVLDPLKPTLPELLAQITPENRHEEVGLDSAREALDNSLAEVTELTTANASEQVIEMLANLSRRIVRLEDEIDTLHRNNVKIAEELANHKAPAETTEVDAVDFNAFTEAVVERVAAKLLGGNTGGVSR